MFHTNTVHVPVDKTHYLVDRGLIKWLNISARERARARFTIKIPTSRTVTAATTSPAAHARERNEDTRHGDIFYVSP